jgi:hypothetical protein
VHRAWSFHHLHVVPNPKGSPPGEGAGMAHEAVFKAVAGRPRAENVGLQGDAVGGPL